MLCARVWSNRRVGYHFNAETPAGPRELSVARASALLQITTCRKSIFYAQNDWRQKNHGMVETRDLDDHRRRRRPWEMALTLKGQPSASGVEKQH